MNSNLKILKIVNKEIRSIQRIRYKINAIFFKLLSFFIISIFYFKSNSLFLYADFTFLLLMLIDGNYLSIQIKYFEIYEIILKNKKNYIFEIIISILNLKTKLRELFKCIFSWTIFLKYIFPIIFFILMFFLF